MRPDHRKFCGSFLKLWPLTDTGRKKLGVEEVTQDDLYFNRIITCFVQNRHQEGKGRIDETYEKSYENLGKRGSTFHQLCSNGRSEMWLESVLINLMGGYKKGFKDDFKIIIWTISSIDKQFPFTGMKNTCTEESKIGLRGRNFIRWECFEFAQGSSNSSLHVAQWVCKETMGNIVGQVFWGYIP